MAVCAQYRQAFVQRVLDPNRRYLDYTLHRAIMVGTSTLVLACLLSILSDVHARAKEGGCFCFCSFEALRCAALLCSALHVFTGLVDDARVLNTGCVSRCVQSLRAGLNELVVVRSLPGERTLHARCCTDGVCVCRSVGRSVGHWTVPCDETSPLVDVLR